VAKIVVKSNSIKSGNLLSPPVLTRFWRFRFIGLLGSQAFLLMLSV
jgi:hypothetical protein